MIIFRKLCTVLLAIVLVVAISAQSMSGSVYAAAPALYFDPASVSATNGSQVTVRVLANGVNFNAAQLDVVYDPASLQYISFGNSGSVLPETLTPAITSNQVSIPMYNLGPVSGDGLFLVSLTFKALAASGSTIVHLADSSTLQSDGNEIAGGDGVQMTVTITSPATTPPPTTTTPTPTQGSTKPAQQQPKASDSSNGTVTRPETTQPTVTPPSGDATAPIQKDLATLGFASEEIQVRVVSNEPTKSIVRYGRSKENLIQTASTDSYSTSYYIPLGAVSKSFAADETCYYVVETFDAAGNKTTSPVRELPIQPVKLTLQVKDKSGEVLDNTTVVINGRNFTTDDEGNVTLNGVLPGLVIVSLKQADGAEDVYMGELTVEAGDATQTFEISPSGATKVGNDQALFVMLAGSAVVLAGLGGGLFIARRLMRPRYPVGHTVTVYGSDDLAKETTPQPQSNLPYHPQTIIQPVNPQPHIETPKPIDNSNIEQPRQL